jgi:hypothetical protein
MPLFKLALGSSIKMEFYSATVLAKPFNIGIIQDHGTTESMRYIQS